jgi:hypothetical protein
MSSLVDFVRAVLPSSIHPMEILDGEPARVTLATANAVLARSARAAREGCATAAAGGDTTVGAWSCSVLCFFFFAFAAAGGAPPAVAGSPPAASSTTTVGSAALPTGSAAAPGSATADWSAMISARSRLRCQRSDVARLNGQLGWQPVADARQSFDTNNYIQKKNLGSATDQPHQLGELIGTLLGSLFSEGCVGAHKIFTKIRAKRR